MRAVPPRTLPMMMPSASVADLDSWREEVLLRVKRFWLDIEVFALLWTEFATIMAKVKKIRGIAETLMMDRHMRMARSLPRNIKSPANAS